MSVIKSQSQLTTPFTGASTAAEFGYISSTPSTIPQGYNAFSIDTLMAYCQEQVNGLGKQILTQMNQQRGLSDRQTAISDLQSMIKSGQTDPSHPNDKNANPDLAGGGGGYNSTVAVANITTKIGDAERDALAVGDTSTYQKLEDVKKTLNNDSDGNVTADEIASMTQSLGDIGSTMSSDAQMGMINIQTLMGQRSTQMQMVSNMLSSVNDTDKAVVQNIKS